MDLLDSDRPMDTQPDEIPEDLKQFFIKLHTPQRPRTPLSPLSSLTHDSHSDARSHHRSSPFVRPRSANVRRPGTHPRRAGSNPPRLGSVSRDAQRPKTQTASRKRRGDTPHSIPRFNRTNALRSSVRSAYAVSRPSRVPASLLVPLQLKSDLFTPLSPSSLRSSEIVSIKEKKQLNRSEKTLKDDFRSLELRIEKLENERKLAEERVRMMEETKQLKEWEKIQTEQEEKDALERENEEKRIASREQRFRLEQRERTKSRSRSPHLSPVVINRQRAKRERQLQQQHSSQISEFLQTSHEIKAEHVRVIQTDLHQGEERKKDIVRKHQQEIIKNKAKEVDFYRNEEEEARKELEALRKKEEEMIKLVRQDRKRLRKLDKKQ
ncbi:hypothetical protein BLNAU_8137 [Blattamonas nauphoetae]|uniref:Uncharacterized protein n=1 Tax=Blattamonas nauphoetae TaxID=2049346 RepID=A0ABQ9XZF6_9EUKA|nr:hypothetical protein BLNAU_8137 [Blattamonas nauphoetae]